MPNIESDFISLDNSNAPLHPKKRARRADAQANRVRLLQAAQRMFAEKGIDAVSMMAIAEEAGVGQGTLYRAFANKGELCVALLDEDLQTFQQQVLTFLRESHAQSALDQLAQFLDQLVHFLDRHVMLMCEVQNYKILGDEVNHTGLHTWFYDTVRRLLQYALDQGEIRSDIELAYLTDVVLALLNPTLFLHQRHDLGLSLETISRSLWGVLLAGVLGNSLTSK